MKGNLWRRLRRCGAVALAAVTALAGTEGITSLLPQTSAGAILEAEASDYSCETATEAVANMRVGWNLGNTLESAIVGMDDYTAYTGKAGTYTLVSSGKCANSSKCSLSTASWGTQLVLTDTAITGTLTGNGYDATFTITLPNAATGTLQVCAGKTYDFSVAALDTDKDGVVTLTSSQIIDAIGASNISTSYVHLQISGGNTSFTKVVCKLTEGSNGSYTSVYETCWGNVVTTQEMIQSVKAQGFDAIRIPVTWNYKMDSNGNVDSKWMDRVEEVVKWAYDEDMYVILNVHHDTADRTDAWVQADTTVYKNTKTKYENLWKQIATRFADYDEHLLFEAYNEMLDTSYTWNNPLSTSGYTAVNSYAQSFVTTVRSCGGYNANRNLIVNTYAASWNATAMNKLTIPTDTVSDHLIMEVHYYDPASFVYNEVQSWLPTVTDTWSSAFDSEVETDLAAIASRATAKGVPVIIGEFSATYDNNDAEQVKYLTSVVSTAKKYGITCFYWDNGDYSQGGSAIFDRSSLTWRSEMTAAIIAAADYTENTDITTPAISNVTAASGTSLKLTWTPVSDADGYVIYRGSSASNLSYYARVTGTDTASYTDTDVDTTRHYYKIAAYKGSERSALSSAVYNLARPVLKNVGFTYSSATTAEVQWTAVSGASGYYIYRKVVGGSWSKIATVTGSSVTSYTDTDGVNRANQYYYYVKAYRTLNGKESCSTYAGMYTLAIPTVHNVTATGTNASKISWSTVSGASGYAIYRKTASGSWSKIATVSGASTSTYTDTSASGTTSYYYAVRAYRTKSSITYYSGYYTSMATLTTPTVRNVNAVSETQMRVYWTKVDGATGYNVYRKVSGGSWTKLASVSSSTLYYDDTKAVSGVQYYYTVRAYRSNSDYSTTSYSYYNTTGVGNLVKPVISSVTATATKTNTVTWSKVTGATRYDVYRKLSNGTYTCIGSTTSTSYKDTTAVSSVTYAYTIRAVREQNGVTGRSVAAAGKSVTTK